MRKCNKEKRIRVGGKGGGGGTKINFFSNTIVLRFRITKVLRKRITIVLRKYYVFVLI